MPAADTITFDCQDYLFKHWADQLHQEDYGNTRDGRLVKVVDLQLAEAELQLHKLVSDPGNDAYSLDDVVGALETAIEELSSLMRAVEQFMSESFAAYKAQQPKAPELAGKL